MKRDGIIIFVILISVHLQGLSQDKKVQFKSKQDTISIGSLDSLDHQLIILDNGFESWLVSQPPQSFHSQQYYEQMNRIYVTEWNLRFMSAASHGLYETYIEYDRGIDYGLDINYRLYYYFKYFEQKNHVKLFPAGKL